VRAVAEFRQFLAQRDEASRRAGGEALAQSVAATDQYNAAVADDNHNRPHSALGGQSPAMRLNNVLGFNT
jgi:hypothetical protein